MPLDLKSRIYKAQTVGNVEPIEHMIPYPNLRSLIDGQNIKYGERVVYKDHNLTSNIIYDKAQQIANWLQSKGIQPKNRVLVKPADVSTTPSPVVSNPEPQGNPVGRNPRVVEQPSPPYT